MWVDGRNGWGGFYDYYYLLACPPLFVSPPAIFWLLKLHLVLVYFYFRISSPSSPQTIKIYVPILLIWVLMFHAETFYSSILSHGSIQDHLHAFLLHKSNSTDSTVLKHFNKCYCDIWFYLLSGTSKRHSKLHSFHNTRNQARTTTTLNNKLVAATTKRTIINIADKEQSKAPWFPSLNTPNNRPNKDITWIDQSWNKGAGKTNKWWRVF